MQRFEVDTPALSATGEAVQEAAGPLANARAALERLQADGYAADNPDVANAVEAFVAGWGAFVTALHDAALGLGRNAIAAANAYETTDQTQMGAH